MEGVAKVKTPCGKEIEVSFDPDWAEKNPNAFELWYEEQARQACSRCMSCDRYEVEVYSPCGELIETINVDPDYSERNPNGLDMWIEQIRKNHCEMCRDCWEDDDEDEWDEDEDKYEDWENWADWGQWKEIEEKFKKEMGNIEEKYFDIFPRIVLEDKYIFPVISLNGNITYCMINKDCNSTDFGWENIKNTMDENEYKKIKEEIIIIDYLFKCYWHEKESA